MQAYRRVAAPALQLLPKTRQTKRYRVSFSSLFVVIFLLAHIFAMVPSNVASAAEVEPSGSSAAAVAFDSKVRAIGAKLRCPVCEGQSIAESHSEVALEMRQEVMRRLLAGESEEEILNAFVEVWGPSILTAPPRQGGYLVAWVGPVLLLLVGIWFLWRYIKRPHTVVETGSLAVENLTKVDDTAQLVEDPKLKQQVEERLRKYL